MHNWQCAPPPGVLWLLLVVRGDPSAAVQPLVRRGVHDGRLAVLRRPHPVRGAPARLVLPVPGGCKRRRSRLPSVFPALSSRSVLVLRRDHVSPQAFPPSSPRRPHRQPWSLRLCAVSGVCAEDLRGHTALAAAATPRPDMNGSSRVDGKVRVYVTRTRRTRRRRGRRAGSSRHGRGRTRWPAIDSERRQQASIDSTSGRKQDVRPRAACV